LDHAVNLKQARLKLRKGRYPVVLTEADLGDGNWTDVLNMVQDLGPKSHVIVTHPFADARFWAEVLNEGAYDVLAQPFYPIEVQRVVFNAYQGAAQRRAASAVL
jgi:DNA-binding NtrC family response regulator